MNEILLFDSKAAFSNLLTSSNKINLINQFQTYGYSNILKQYSNFFEQWATMIYALGDKVRNGYYYDKSRWVHPSKEKLQLLLQNQALQDPIQTIAQNLKTDLASELFSNKSAQKNIIHKT